MKSITKTKIVTAVLTVVTALACAAAIYTFIRWNGAKAENEKQSLIYKQLSALEAEMTDLGADIEKLAADIEADGIENNELAAATAALQTEYETLKASNDAYENGNKLSYADLEKLYAALQNSYSSLRSKYADLEKEFGGAE